METMRRLFTALVGLGLLNFALGCNHVHEGCVHGVCDCDPGSDPCYYGPSMPAGACGTTNPSAPGPVPVPAPIAKPTPPPVPVPAPIGRPTPPPVPDLGREK